MSNANPAARVRLDMHGHVILACTHRSGLVYNHLTATYRRVLEAYQDAPAATRGAPPAPHPYLAMVKDRVAPFLERATPFEQWPRALVTDLARHAPVTDVAHPMATPSRATPEALRPYVKLVRRLLRRLPPVQADVWLRLLYHMLPVNCRFSYLQAQDPSAVCCTYGCGAVETQYHALRACARVQALWAFHAGAWANFGVDFGWSRITQLDHFPVNTRGLPHIEALQTLWLLLVGATLHFVWRDHNAVQYEALEPPPVHAWQETSFLAWTASIRRWLRLQDPDCPVRAGALRVLGVLRWQRAYRPLWAKYPSCLLLRPTSTFGPG
ncbi:hypothetical protein ACHHYP_14755 [Achlya hypogyna]|uniref:Reverse transcriptase zinc-binding domain-containing protein n=1 Tax=Achlya hypogyna TaxID=1202772 RepID=A0A1V9YCC3_ACHHY|nr:hypothetical protein ACHHYP_14755 [Achlya hypogyna]